METKIYVEVTAHFDLQGKMIPESIVWVDGRVFEIDRVKEARRAPSLKAGGQGMRYTCRIHGQERYLFFDDIEQKWFIESTNPCS